jgi:hypothetical protein
MPAADYIVESMNNEAAKLVRGAPCRVQLQRADGQGRVLERERGPGPSHQSPVYAQSEYVVIESKSAPDEHVDARYQTRCLTRPQLFHTCAINKSIARLGSVTCALAP